MVKMYQVSTLQALAMGYTRGVITVQELLSHGTIGLGTFEDVNGEMILLDGECYRATETGEIVSADPEMKVPFVSVANIEEGRRVSLDHIPDIGELKKQLTILIEEDFGLNSMHVVRIDGIYSKVCARSESGYRAHHIELKEMLSRTQKDFIFDNISGTMVCVYYPDYMDGINAAGWHLHFVSDDRTQGGHVFDLTMEQGQAQITKIGCIEIQMPTEPAFDTYSLKNASGEDIKKVEQGE